MMIGPVTTGGEKAHDPLDPECLNQPCQNNVDKTCRHHTAAGVGQHFEIGRPVLKFRRDHRIAAQKSKGGTEKCRNLALGDQVKEQGARGRRTEG